MAPRLMRSHSLYEATARAQGKFVASTLLWLRDCRQLNHVVGGS